MSDLARKLAAHPRWRWVEGMLLAELGYARRWRIGGRDTDHTFWLVVSDGQVRWAVLGSNSEWTPDLTDAATAGVLLGQIPHLREVVHRENPEAWCVRWAELPAGSVWRVSTRPWCPTLGEAAALALLSLWGPS